MVEEEANAAVAVGWAEREVGLGAAIVEAVLVEAGASLAPAVDLAAEVARVAERAAVPVGLVRLEVLENRAEAPGTALSRGPQSSHRAACTPRASEGSELAGWAAAFLGTDAGAREAAGSAAAACPADLAVDAAPPEPRIAVRTGRRWAAR